nr:MAG TPA: hypothetical protein [Caudoviricetes sp.]
MALTAKKVYAILKRQISDMEAKLNSPVRYRGTVATADLLPLNPDIGDMYNIESKSVYGEAGMNVAWNGVVWDTMGAPIDMSLYIKSSELADWVKQQNKPAYTAEEVGALPADTKIPSKTSELKNDSGFLTKVPDSYLNGTDTTLKESGKAADAKATGDKFTEISADISKKLDKNQGSENSGKIAGINESGDIVPMFPVGVEYNEETNCLEFGSDQGMKLNQGIGLDSTLTKTGFAADAGVTGKEINSLKESISTKITKFYASSQGETHLADSDNGKIMDMMVYGKSEQKQYSGKNLVKATLESTTKNGITCTNNGDGTYTLNGTANGGDDTTVSFNVGHMIAKSGKYIVVGCPKGGSSEKYNLRIGKDDIPWGTYLSSDLGNGRLIDVTENTPITLTFMIKTGYTCNNVLFKPMIVDASLYPDTTYDDFEPYTGGIPSPNPDYPQEILSVKNPVVKVCGKNLLKSTYPTTTKNGVTCTNNNDGTFSLNGTATANCVFIILGQDALKNAFGVNEKLRLTGAPKGSSRSGYYLQIWKDTPEVIYYDIGEGVASKKPNARCNVAIMVTNGTVCNNVLFKPMLTVDPTVTYDDFEPYHETEVTLPYDLYSVKVASGGNVTIGSQQYIADYVDVERGKLVRMCKHQKLFDMNINDWGSDDNGARHDWYVDVEKYDNTIFVSRIIPCLVSSLKRRKSGVSYPYFAYETIKNNGWVGYSRLAIYVSKEYDTLDKLKEYVGVDTEVVYQLKTPEEINLTPEEIKAFKALATYYPTTNISINSEQLDGYTVFNYPISMENGWNYVKQQIGDTRDYIYDMDARTQDTDLQAAEAYVNSEYAVALTELEV